MKALFPLLCVGLVCMVASVFATNMAQCKQGDTMAPFRLFPVGKVKKDSGITTIEVYDKYADALLGLNQFSHVVVLYWFHKNDIRHLLKQPVS